MALRGLAAGTTIYARSRTLARLQAWLTVYGEDLPGCREGERSTPGATRVIRSGSPAGASSLLDASHADLVAWRTSLHLSPRSIASYCDQVREFYAWLVRSEYRPDNPALGLPVPRLGRSLPRPISEADLQRALESAPRRVRPWLVLAGWGGLRAKEIALLRRENVADTVRRPFILIAEDATKGHAEHVVWMSTFVLAELRAYGMPSRGWMFTRHDGRPGPNSPGYVSKLCNRQLRASGSDATLHQLRHRLLSLLYEQTRDIRLVQETAGHRSLETTQIYTRVSDSGAAAAMDAIPSPTRLRVVGE
jgi:integrase/recombinase XerC